MNFGRQGLDGMPSGPKKLLTAREISNLFGLSKSFVYQHTIEGAKHPLPVVRIGERAVRFDPDRISTYIRSRERHWPSARLGSFDGIARANRKGEIQIGS